MNETTQTTIRIDDVEILHLMRLCNELRYIHKNIVKPCKRDTIEPERLSHLISRWNDTVSQLQESVYLIYCLPVGRLFKRLASVARSILKEDDRQILVLTDGHDIKIHPIVLDEIGYILMNWIGNTIGHGFESAEIRCQMGKPPEGTLHLHAYTQEKDVVIEVLDDGKGIDFQRIKAIAIELGLYDIERITGISEPEILNNLMLGRYTRQSFRELGIIVEIQTQLHQGTTLKLRISGEAKKIEAN